MSRFWSNGAMRSNRSPSINSAAGAESFSAYSNSGPVHQALSETEIAPMTWHAQKLMIHSG